MKKNRAKRLESRNGKSNLQAAVSWQVSNQKLFDIQLDKQRVRRLRKFAVRLLILGRYQDKIIRPDRVEHRSRRKKVVSIRKTYQNGSRFPVLTLAPAQ